MDWQLIEYKSFPGKNNMELDLELVKNCKSNSPILRFYGWTPYCISLGANQSYREINISLADKDNIDVVKRPTGGRAILHAEELTYSVIMPNNNQVSGKLLYNDISNAIVSGLRFYNTKLNEVELENINPDFPNLLNEPSGSICFASTAKSEIKFNGKKLVGSAQRKLGSTILQHGSLLIGKFHQNLVKFLNISEEEKFRLNYEIEEKTIEISTILGEDVNINILQNAIISGFEKVFNANFLFNDIKAIPI